MADDPKEITNLSCLLEIDSDPKKLQEVWVELPNGKSALFGRRTTWDNVDQTPENGCRLLNVCLMNTRDLSEASALNE
jgi:hypothetical protein